MANAVGENAMTPLAMITVLSILAILLTPSASANYYQGTDDIQQLVIAQAKRQNILPSLALAIAKVESNFNPQALSHAGAKGVMQIMPRTAEQTFGVSRGRLFDPDVNIELGVKFIKKLLKRYDGRLDIALSHYNGGSKVKNRHGELSVIPATRNYVDKVLATQQDFLHHDGFLQHGNLQRGALQNRNRGLFTSHFNQPSTIQPSTVQPDINQSIINHSGVHYVHRNTGKTQSDVKMFDEHSQNPQINTLRALRLHNITRNYKGKNALSLTGKPAYFANVTSGQISRNAKIAKVRQWESIYPDPY